MLRAVSAHFKRALRWLRWPVALTALGAALLWIWVGWAAFPTALLAPETVQGHRVFDRHGRLLRETLGVEGRSTWRSLAASSPWIAPAFVAIEDRRFYEHGGVDPQGIARAVWSNLRAGAFVAGGSTLTQQVVKRVRPQPRTLWGKLHEAVLAWRLERVASKPQILEQYVNRAPFGHGAVGIEAAAQQYFDTSADRLSLAQVALLVGIPRAPSLNNPWADPARARRRQRVVLAALEATGAITPAQHAEARAEPVQWLAPRARFLAPHWTTWVLAQDPVPGAVPTTLDLDLQTEVQAAVQMTLRALAERHVQQAAVVVLHTPTGEVLAWQGRADFFDPGEGQVDMVTRRRQPGSTLKPFVYSLALESGLSPETLLPDLPLFFPTALGDYRPRNYDRRFHGWVSLRAALANSYNVPAVWMAHQVGVGAVLRRLQAVGFASLDRPAEHYGLGLALGNGEVRLIELANAYRALANHGRWRPWRWRRDVPAGATAVEGHQAIEPKVADQLTAILADPVARVPAFGQHNVLTLPFPVAAKTGTSTDWTDNWTVGYTAAITVAVWVGNFDGVPMQGVSGITGAGPLFRRVMRAAAARYPAEALRVEVPAAPPAVVPRQTLRVIYPDQGDVFSLDAHTPARHARLRLRAEAPPSVRQLVWAMDGVVIATTARPFERWWPSAAGLHRLEVWPVGAPEQATGVRFEVLR